MTDQRSMRSGADASPSPRATLGARDWAKIAAAVVVVVAATVARAASPGPPWLLAAMAIVVASFVALRLYGVWRHRRARAAERTVDDG